MKFRFLTGDVNWLAYGGKWVSSKQNNGDFDYWLVLDFVNMEEACGSDNDGKPKYHVELCAVSPHEAGETGLASAFECCGVPEDAKQNPLCQVEALHSYGISAHLWQADGKNAHKLLREAKRQAQMVNGLFGFFMDRTENRIGSTGWEFIKGDLNSGLARTIASGSPEGRILAKMHGVTV